MAGRDLSQGTDLENGDNLRAVYNQLCESYRAIDSFRGTLLGLLPLASSGGIFLLSGMKVDHSLYLPIGAFGAFITLGLFIFEIYGTIRCAKLIDLGKKLERNHLHVDGQFATRPPGIEGFCLIPKRIARLVNEPLASGIIYPAVLGAWVFLALYERPGIIVAGICGVLIFTVGFWASFKFNQWLTPPMLSERHEMPALQPRKPMINDRLTPTPPK